MRRRKLLRTGGALTLLSIPLAGCSGDDDGDGGGSDTGDGGDGSDDDGGGSDTGDGGNGSDGDIITGGDASMTFSMNAPEQGSEIGQFEELTISFERVLFEQESGGFAEVDIGEEIDLTTLPIPDEGGETYVDGVDFPAGTYTRAELYFSVSSAALTDGTEPSFELDTPAEVDLEILDEFYEITTGSSNEFTLRMSVFQSTGYGGAWQFEYGHVRT